MKIILKYRNELVLGELTGCLFNPPGPTHDDTALFTYDDDVIRLYNAIGKALELPNHVDADVKDFL